MDNQDPRQAAEERMRFAKRRFSEAARMALAGDPEAEGKARSAYAEVESVRAELARLDDQGQKE